MRTAHIAGETRGEGAGENYDILQDATNVLVIDEGSSTVTAIDPARVSLGDSTGIPGGAKVDLGSRTAAILDEKSGALWVVPVRGIAQFEIEAADPIAELGENALRSLTDGILSGAIAWSDHRR